MIFIKARLLRDKAGYDRMNRRIDTTKRIALPIPTVDIVFAEGWVYRKSFVQAPFDETESSKLKLEPRTSEIMRGSD